MLMPEDNKPKFVSISQLKKVLAPYMDGISWAEEALEALWTKGAPSPNPFDHRCGKEGCRMQLMGHDPCTGGECYLEKRLLLPEKFAEWWQEVADRQGMELKMPKGKDE